MSARLGPLFGGAAALVALVVDASAASAMNARMFVDGSLAIPPAVISTLGALLPERVPVAATLVSDAYDPNLEVLAAAKVRVTFLREGAGYANTLGYFTYASDNAGVHILTRQLIFPNVSGDGAPLSTGDVSTLRDEAGEEAIFAPGTRIGFFVVADGWNGSGVRGWDPAAPSIPSTSASANGAGLGVFTTLDVLNPESGSGRPDVARHYVSLHLDGTPGFLGGADYHVVGIDDQRRDVGSDNDFNDILFLVQSTPEDAVRTVRPIDVATSNPDPDGDGVAGLLDAYPEDPERAFVVRSPATGYQAVAFEDTYPGNGDMDYNDAVVEYAYDQVLRADGRLKELVGTFHLVARGAGLDHSFGVALRGVPTTTSGSVQLECWSSAGEHTLSDASIGSLLVADGDAASALRVPVFADTRAALPDTNTSAATPTGDPASCRFVAVFDAPLDTAVIGAAPYDPYLAPMHEDGGYDIHLPGKAGFSDRPASLPIEEGPQSFVDGSGYPWALLVPSDFRFPLERMRIDEGQAPPYRLFGAWKASGGSKQTTWYMTPNTSTPARVAAKVDPAKLVHPWTIDR